MKRAPHIKHFEVWLGNQWIAWERDDYTKITLNERIVTVIAKRDRGVVTATIDLDLVPAYCFS